MGAVFLDLDGTLSDSVLPITQSVAHALRAVGTAVPDQARLRSYVGPPLIDTFTALGVPDPELALVHYRMAYTGGAMFDAPVFEGIFPALSAMQADGHRLYLMTAKPHHYARKITAHLGLSPYLLREYGPEMDGRFNNKADLLAHACAELGEVSETSVMVGDRASDLNAGLANSIPVIAAMWGYGSPEEMARADLLLDRPHDLPDAVNRLI